MPRIIAIIQARMGSTRLPGKIMMPFAGQPLLQRIIERVSWSSRLEGVAVATTTLPSDDVVAKLCADLDVPCIRGSQDDVLARMLQAAHQLEADVIVRLTGDNPVVDGTLIDFVLDGFLEADPSPDYAANFGQEPCETGFPYGLYAEVAAVSALEISQPLTTEYDREHVTWFIRTHPEQFNILKMDAPGEFAHEFLTVDTPEDYARVGEIFEKHYEANPRFGFADLMLTAA